MDAFTFDRLTRLVAVARSRRRLGTAIIGAATGLLGLSEAAAAPCPKGRKRCKKRCIPKRQCCTNANCPKGSGKVCRRGSCVCPKSRKRCRNQCIPKAACCGGCPPGLICKQGTCCLDTSPALTAALLTGGPAVIRLCPGTTYAGNFIIARNVAIIGSGASSTILNGGEDGPVVQVPAGMTAGLHDLQITKGLTGGSGGGVSNQGDLTLTRCLVTDNRATTFGGGIGNSSSTGAVVLINSAVTNNRAHNGGGIGNVGGFVLLRGATLVSGNTVTAAGGGILSDGSSSRVILQDATLITDNEAPLTDPTSGGGIWNGPTAPAVLLFDTAQVIGNRPNDCTGPGCPP